MASMFPSRTASFSDVRLARHPTQKGQARRRDGMEMGVCVCVECPLAVLGARSLAVLAHTTWERTCSGGCRWPDSLTDCPDKEES